MSIKVNRLPLLVVAALLLSSVGLGTVWSYLRTAHRAMGQSLQDAVPVEFELKRLQQMTDDLIPEIRANQQVAAQLEVEVEYLDREVQGMRQGQAKAKEQMQKLRTALKERKEMYTFGGKQFTARQIEQDLSRRLDRYESGAAQLTAKAQILAARRQTLAAASEKINQYREERERLVQKAESLQAELQLAELGQASGSFQFDHSKLAEAKAAAQQVEKRIRTLQKLVDGERQVAGEVPVDADTRPAAQRYDEVFKGK